MRAPLAVCVHSALNGGCAGGMKPLDEQVHVVLVCLAIVTQLIQDLGEELEEAV